MTQPHPSWQTEGENVEVVTDFFILASKTTVDGACSHEIRRHLTLGRKAMWIINSVLRSRNIILPNKLRCLAFSFGFLNFLSSPHWSLRNPTCDKVMQKEAWQNARTWSGFRSSPWNFLSIHAPRTESACFTVLCFPPTLLSLTGGCTPTTFFWKKLNFELLDNKSPGHNMSVSIQKPLWWLSSLPTGLVQLRMWLFEAYWLQKAQEA